MGLFQAIKSKFISKQSTPTDYKVVQLTSVDSTNTYLRTYMPEEGEKMTIVIADYQTAGRGQGTNEWESENGKNLLFSVLVHPSRIPLRQQFLLAEAGALALKEVINQYVPEDITLKWPNDIYWKDKKLSGTLIETKLSGGHIKDFVFGVGLNVNQTDFKSDAPNPISLCGILGHEVDRETLLTEIVTAFRKYFNYIEHSEYDGISGLYHESLYRKKGFYQYKDQNGYFEGAIVEVEVDGHLVLRTREGMVNSYLFKEVEFVL